MLKEVPTYARTLKCVMYRQHHQHTTLCYRQHSQLSFQFVTAVILLIIFIASTGTTSIHILIDESLVLHQEHQVAEYINYLDESMSFEDQGLNATFWPIRSWDAFELARADNNILASSQPNNHPASIMAILPCETCHFLTRTYASEIPFCHVACFDDLAGEWNDCDDYLRSIEAFVELVTTTSNGSDSLILVYDKYREEALQPVIDSLAESTKGMYHDSWTPVQHAADQSLESLIPLSNATLRETSHFIVSVNVESTIAILRQGFDMNVLGPEYNWLVDIRTSNSNYVEEALSEFMQGGDNVALVSLNHSHLTPDGGNSLFREKCTDTGLAWDFPRRHDDEDEEDTLLVKKCVGNCKSPSTLTTVSSFTDDTGRWENLSEIFPKEFEGFHGRYFNIVTREYDPFVIVDVVNGTRVYSGLCIALLDVLSETLDFKYNLFDVRDGKFGILDNGSWNGMIGEVHRKEMDMAVSGITVSAEREEAVDFTFPYWEEPTAVLVRRTPYNTKLYWVFRPLHYYVWLLIFASFFVVAALITLFTHVSKNEKPPPCEDPLWKIKNSLWYVTGAFFQQGGYQLPTTFPGQSMAGCWWCVVVVMYGIYTGNLIAFLAVTKITLAFESLEEMTSQTEYKYGVEDGIIQMMLFQTADSGIYKDIWKGIKSDPSNIVESGDDGVQKVLHDKYAFIGDKTNIHTLATATENCDLVFIKEEFYKVGFGFALQDGWPYKKYFDSAIMKLVEGGFTEKWRREFWPEDVCVIKDQYVKSQAITLADLSGNFVVLCAGISIATLLFLAERLNRHLRKRGIQCVCDHCEIRCHQKPPESSENGFEGDTVFTDNGSADNAYQMHTTATTHRTRASQYQNGIHTHAPSQTQMQNGIHMHSSVKNTYDDTDKLRKKQSSHKSRDAAERSVVQNFQNASYLDQLTDHLSTTYSKPPSPSPSYRHPSSPTEKDNDTHQNQYPNRSTPSISNSIGRRHSSYNTSRSDSRSSEPRSTRVASTSKVMLELL